MADTNTTTTGTQGTGTQVQGSTGGNDTPRKLYQTRSDAEANKPADATKNSKVYEVAKGGAVLGYLWAQGYADCAQWAARTEGFKFSLGKTKEVTKEAVVAKLATFSDDELAAMGLSRTPPATTTTKPAGKGGKK
jgi:hypothetical protein